MKILFDGAFGTYFKEQGGQGPCENANLENPALVESIHREYLAAGAEAIKTNTFGTKNPSLIRAGFSIAQKVAQKKRVFCDIGPEREDPETAYLTAARAFLEEGGTDFLFETLPDTDGLLPALEEIKSQVSQSFIIVSFAVDQDGFTARGRHIRSLFAEADACPYIDAVGINCLIGAAHMKRLLSGLHARKPVSVMPNAGYPSRESTASNAAYFAEKVAEMYEEGVSLVGGCCGTTPTHIACLKEKLATARPRPQARPHLTAKREEKQFTLLAGKRIIAEIDPPLGTDYNKVLSDAETLLQAGAHILSVGDSPMARPRCDAMMLAARLRRDLGADVLPHLTCRDRNHIAMKGLLLGAAMEGIDKLLIVRGDAIPKVDRHTVDGVFSFNSNHLIEFVRNLNEELFDPGFLIAAALNVNAVSFGAELNRAFAKQKCGARLFVTQPLYTEASLENLRQAKTQLSCPIIAGLMPLASYKNALFINNEVPGITIPPEVTEKLRTATPEEIPGISAGECARLAQAAAPFCDGYFLTTPLRRVDITVRLIGKLRNLT